MSATISRDISALIHDYLSDDGATMSPTCATWLALTDALTDAGLDEFATKIRAEGFEAEEFAAMLNATGRKVGRKSLGSWLLATMKAATLKAYQPRRDRTVNPEGKFDGAGRWYPSDREDGGDIAGCIRGPSRAFPYSYMLACRTKKHAACLVFRCILGVDVPADVLAAAKSVRDALLAELSK